VTKRIAFCGVGALGSMAVQFCRSIDVILRLVDFDRVESKNLQAQWFVKQSLGKNKADAVRLQLANFYGVKAEARGVRLRAHNAAELLDGCDLAVDCFDNFESRELLSSAARTHAIPLLHAALAADGTFGLIRWDERFAPDREDSEGQATCEGGEHLPMIGVLASTLAREIQSFVRDGARHDYMVSLTGVVRQ
jgi:molybdopterin/thiamine biosynthesis adenylyltransferase